MRSVVVFTGGGSGGHIFPGLAVLEKLRQQMPELETVWFGSGSPMEREIVTRFGIRFVAVPSGKLRRYFSLRNLVDLFKIASGFVVSLVRLSRLRPALLFSKGGFVSVPPVVAARVLGIPVFTHESDVDPGLATRINTRFAERIFVAYEESRRYFPAHRAKSIVVSGNPVRDEVFAGNAERGRRLVGARGDRPLLLVLGGSQGARQVNRLVAGALDALLEDYDVVHQMGEAGYEEATRAGLFRVGFFADEYPDVLAAADLVVGRSGAGTLWELAACGKASILVPLVRYTRGDQLRNAERFASCGAAIVLDDPTPEALAAHAKRLAREPDELAAMGRAAQAIFRSDAAGLIAAEISRRIGAGDAYSPA